MTGSFILYLEVKMNVVEIINNTDKTLEEVAKENEAIERAAKSLMDVCDSLVRKEKECSKKLQ